VSFHPSAGIHERLEIPVGHFDAAQAIEQDAHLHALALLRLERRQQRIAELPCRPDVHGDIDRPIRVANRIEQRGHELVAVVQHRDRAAMSDRGADDCGQRRREVRRINARW
jgi:hypothetical protein